jgi:hypothetical protein
MTKPEGFVYPSRLLDKSSQSVVTVLRQSAFRAGSRLQPHE